MSYGRPRNHGCRISDDWTFQGLRAILIENELLRVTVLAGKGSDIVEFRYKPLDLDFLLRAPGGVRNPTREPVSAPSGSAFLDYYSGGWNEILPNGGPQVTYKGADLGQHGEVSLLPWEHAIVDDTPERVAVRLSVRPLRTPFFLEKTLSMQPGRAALEIKERLTNEAGEPLDFMWGQHIAFGRPFLDEGVVIDAPARDFLVHDPIPGFEPRRFQPGWHGAWPHAVAAGSLPGDASVVPPYSRQNQAQEMAYLTGFDEGWYAITNSTRHAGFALLFDPKVYRYVWYWQQLGDVAQGYPWWSRVHTAALEPWTSYPTNGLADAIANGTALRLLPGEELTTGITALAYSGSGHVAHVAPGGIITWRDQES